MTETELHLVKTQTNFIVTTVNYLMHTIHQWMVTIFSYFKFQYPKLNVEKWWKFEWVRIKVILVQVAQKSICTKLDLVISFSVLNSFWWTKNLIIGNKCGYKFIWCTWSFNWLQLITTDLWTVLKDFWNEAISNQNIPKFEHPQPKKQTGLWSD